MDGFRQSTFRFYGRWIQWPRSTRCIKAAVFVLASCIPLITCSAELTSRKATANEAILGSTALDVLRRSPSLAEVGFSRATTVLSDDCKQARIGNPGAPCVVLNAVVRQPYQVARICYSIILELEAHCAKADKGEADVKLCRLHREGGLSLNLIDSSTKTPLLRSVLTH